MFKKNLVFGISIFILVSIADAKYYVLDSQKRQLASCDSLEIEKDNQERFSRAVFSGCNGIGEVFSFSGDFRYRKS